MTLFEVTVAVLLTMLLLAIIMAMTLPVYQAGRRRSARADCIENLQQISVALRTWEEDGGPRTSLLETNSQTIGLDDGQRAWVNVLGISNIVRLSKVLHCPIDTETPMTTTPFGVKMRFSYFLNLDARLCYPQELLSGDDNIDLGNAISLEPLIVNGTPVEDVPVKPGILVLPSKTPFSWSDTTRHMLVGNISLADGSVQEESSYDLEAAIQISTTNATGVLTNRIAIP